MIFELIIKGIKKLIKILIKINNYKIKKIIKNQINVKKGFNSR